MTRYKGPLLIILAVLIGTILNPEDTSVYAGPSEEGAYFDCNQFRGLLLNDVIALQAAESALLRHNNHFKLECLSILMENNLFKT